jgi:hypothetical protein
MQEIQKAQYEAPTLTVVGTFEDITQGQARGSQLDATFPTGTPFGDLTFS